jgi:hypothetical protein
MSLSQTKANTLAACQNACACNLDCLLWQWDASNTQGPCWTGSDCSSNETNPAWTSFVRTPPGPAPPTPPCTDSSQPCSPGYADGSWRNVNTPHDFIVEGAPDQNADRGHGYLPFNTSWWVGGL